MKKQQIKKVSMQLFADLGYVGTSMSEIAKQVGIKKPSLYAYFKSKEDLFLSVFSEVLETQVQHIQQLSQTIQHKSIETQLYQILSDACFYYLDQGSELAFLKRTMLFPPLNLAEQLSERFLEVEQEFSKILQQIFQAGIKQGIISPKPMETLLSSYYCLQDGAFLQSFYYGTERLKQKLPHIWQIYWTGITQLEK